MELNNEMRARIFAAYWGSEYVILFDKDKYSDPITIDRKVFAAMIEKPETPRFIILTPLDEISDEDAIIIYGILCGVVKSDRYTVSRNKTDTNIESIYNVDANDDDKETLYIPHSLEIYANQGGKIVEFDGIRIQWCIDFLRSKSYDCGYGSIPSLIQSKIAIQKGK